MKKLLLLIPVLLLAGCSEPLGHHVRVTSPRGTQWEVCTYRDNLVFGNGSVGFDTPAGRVVVFGATVEPEGECIETD